MWYVVMSTISSVVSYNKHPPLTCQEFAPLSRKCRSFGSSRMCSTRASRTIETRFPRRRSKTRNGRTDKREPRMPIEGSPRWNRGPENTRMEHPARWRVRNKTNICCHIRRRSYSHVFRSTICSRCYVQSLASSHK